MISNTASVATYTGNGSQQVFDVKSGSEGIYFSAASELYVTLRAGATVTAQTIATHYTVSGAGTDTGEITFLTAPANGVEVRIERRTPLTQDLSLTSGGAFNPVSVEDNFDKVFRALQDQARGGSGGQASGTFDGDPLTKDAGGTYWDGEDLIARGFANGVNDDDLATVGQVADLVEETNAAYPRWIESATAPDAPHIQLDHWYESDTDKLSVYSGSDFVEVVKTSRLADTTDAAKGTALIGYKSTETGAVGMTLSAKLGEMVSLADFGVVGGANVSDSVAEANAVALQVALDKGIPIYVPFQFVVLKDAGGRFPSGSHLWGRGVGYWNPVYPQNAKGWYGTNFIMKGSSGATTKNTITGITGMRYAGGRREDPENPGEYFDLTSLMNADASGTTPATPRQLSVAFAGKDDAVNWGMHGIRVIPWLGTDGYSDYSNQSNTALSHPWDIGVLIEDSEGVDIEDCQFVGHWRVYGGAIVSPGFDDWGHVERNSIRRCMFQGVTGFGIRGADQWAVSARTSSTVTIRWSEESYWPTTGSFLGIGGNVTYTYTGLTRVGNDLRFDGVSPDPTVAAPFQIRNAKAGSGIAGTQLEDILWHGLEHEGGGDSESLGLPISKPLEVSGAVLRGIQGYNIKAHSFRERVGVFFHDVTDWISFGFQVEGSQSNIIASPTTSLSTAVAPVGASQNIRNYASVGFRDVKNTLWTPRSEWRDADQMSPKDELEAAFLRRALPSQDTIEELATGKKFIVRNDDETTLFEINEATGQATFPNQTNFTGEVTGSGNLRAGGSSAMYFSGRAQFRSAGTAAMSVRNSTNSADATLDVATPTAANHAANKAYVDRGFYVLAANAPRASHTGSTAEVVLATETLPAVAMGGNGVLRITPMYSVTNNANIKTTRVRLGGTGGTAFLSGSLTTHASARMQVQIHNVASQSAQVSNTSAPSGAFALTANSVVTGTIDTSVAQDIVFTGQLANSADTITLESYLIEIFYQA